MYLYWDGPACLPILSCEYITCYLWLWYCVGPDRRVLCSLVTSEVGLIERQRQRILCALLTGPLTDEGHWWAAVLYYLELKKVEFCWCVALGKVVQYCNIVMWCSRYWCVALGNADSKRTRPQHSGGAVPSNTSSISHFCRVLPVFHFVPVAIVRVCLKTSEDLQTLSSTVIYFHWTIFIKKMSGTDKDPLLSLTTRWAQSFLSGSRIILSLYFINPICREI